MTSVIPFISKKATHTMFTNKGLQLSSCVEQGKRFGFVLAVLYTRTKDYK